MCIFFLTACILFTKNIGHFCTMSINSYVQKCTTELLMHRSMPVKDLIGKCGVPHEFCGLVAHTLLHSDKVVTTGNILEHIWKKMSVLLIKDATHEICINTWSEKNNVPERDGFRRYVLLNLTSLGLHSRQKYTVRVSTPLNAYDIETLRESIRIRGFSGVSREVVISEYNNAYIDIRKMEAAGEIFTTYDRLWFVNDVKLFDNLTKFHSLVVKALKYDMHTIQEITHLLKAEQMDVEFALVDLCKERIVQSQDGGMFIFTVIPGHTYLMDCQAAEPCSNYKVRSHKHKTLSGTLRRARQKTRR